MVKLSFEENMDYEALKNTRREKSKFYFSCCICRVSDNDDKIEALKLFNTVDEYGNCTLHPYISHLAESVSLREPEKIKVLDLGSVETIENKDFFKDLTNLKVLIANDLLEFMDRDCLANLSNLRYIEVRSMVDVDIVRPSSLRKINKNKYL